MLSDSEKLELINAMEFIEDDADGENCTSVTVKDTKINRDILNKIGFDRSYLEYEGLIDEYGDINVAPIAFKYCNWWSEYYFTHR
ncbi:hypothetical protein [Clostridium akagii]|uniref:hypothetical protein n=1 Tax=Clostridium akagii TaxID=91623 RepID=UPI00047A78FD|nr:hypothetical protein [Clostridium akagii]